MGKRLTIALAVLALVVLAVGTYVGGYLWLGNVNDWTTPVGGGIDRAYPQQWMVTIYRPAGKLEAWLRGVQVEIFRPLSEEELNRNSYLNRQSSRPLNNDS